MPRKSTPNVKKKQFEFKGFVDPVFEAGDKETISKLYNDGWGYQNALLDFTQSGHKVSFSWDDRNNTHIVSVTCKDPGSSNFGYILSARHFDPDKALLVAHWYHYERCDGFNWKGDQSGDDFNW